ncbi:lytic murein transglycosylase [Reyranella sp. CPCC 100927]|uniref:lytic murein transglycosylase n=1 Tax=Reyranella sp. CPCC 100927 TaxID=2599616 RepID=UPI0011B534D7|nr:lytic murein transglycosylase [Reyranella sp. CPCC 100927]TWT05082.1 lytic murein transglycosylase [Reyranella sp. CPCC 100927]
MNTIISFVRRQRSSTTAILLAGGLLATMGNSSATAQSSDFRACLDAIRDTAAGQGVPQAVADQALRTITPDPRVIDLDGKQPEFTLTLGRYLGNAISAERIAKGQQLLARHRALLDPVEREYGVQSAYLVAFWGLETNYGTIMGDFSVIRSLATLACQTKRGAFFSNELVQALKILSRNHMSAAQMKGSWAGAMGNTQFMPSTYVNYAVDRDGDGRVDLWASLPDVFASSANFLSKSGWKRGQPSHEEVALPQAFDYARVDLSTERTAREWQALGVRYADGRSLNDFGERAAIALPAGYRGPAFLLWPNYKTIMVWNRSQLYALSVGELARQIQGGSGLMRQPPADDQPLSREAVFDLQGRLQRLNLYSDEIDGLLGPRTRAAIRDFQVRAGVIADGYPTLDTLARLRTAAP